MATYTTHQDFNGSTVSFGAEDIFTGISNEASGGAITAVSSANVTITGSTFTGNTTGVKGGALYMQYAFTTVTIDGALFENNLASPGESGGYAGGAIQSTVQNTSYTSLTVSGSTFTNNSVGTNCKGGAMDLWGKNLSTGNLFTGNTATYGGAINDYQIFTDIGSTFTNNIGVIGGAFSQTNAGGWSAPGSTFTNTKFVSNTAGNGGAFYGAPTGTSGTSTFYSNFQMDGVEFTGNTATTAGGAIMNNSEFGNIANSYFVANEATGLGGAILNNGTITITGTLFNGNYSVTAGGGAIHNSKRLIIDGGTFCNNITQGGNAVAYGGAISNDGTATISNVEFIGNTANGAGGAIHIASGAWTAGPTATVTNCLFEDNVSVIGYNGGYGGGAIFVNEHYETYNSLTVTDSVFRGNQALAGKGGAMDMWGGIVSNNNLFENNSALTGGAIDIYQVFTDTGSTFTNNTAANGGAIGLTNAGGWSNPTVSFTDSFITGNTATVTEAADGKVTEGNGAGIYGTYLLTVNGGTVSNNITRGNGGGIYFGGGTAHIDGTLIDSNTAAYGVVGADKGGGYGGGIHIASGSALIENATITNNYGDTYYGGAGLSIFGNVTVDNTLFEGNRGGMTGGGIGSIWNSWTLSGSTVTGNTAGQYGGGVSKWAGGSDSTATIIDSVISNNYAGTGGGGIYGKNFVITGTLVEGNSATDGGGMDVNTHIDRGFATITGSTFANNIATKSAGAILVVGRLARDKETNEIDYTLNFTLNATDTIFSGNTAGGSGGAILVSSDDTQVAYANLTNCVFDGNVSNNDPYGGGALYNNSWNAIITVEGSTFTNNIAAGAGGAITNLRGLTEINNTLFEGNTSNGAGYSGGAISEFGMGTVSVNNSTFSHNVGIVAGAIDATSVNSPSTVIVKNTLFTGNTAAIGAIKTRGAYNYLENVTFETATDNVNIETAKSITLKGDIITEATMSMSVSGEGATIKADGLNILFGSENVTWFGNSIVTAEGATTGLESVMFANSTLVYFAEQDLTGVEVAILTGPYREAGTYTLASGITAMDSSVIVMDGMMGGSHALDTPYMISNDTLVQKVNFGDSVLTVTTADTLYVGVDASAANGFDFFETQADLEAVYGQGFAGTVISYVPQQVVCMSESWTQATVPSTVTLMTYDFPLTWNTNAFNDMDKAKRMRADDGLLAIVGGLDASSYIVDCPTYFLGGDFSNLDVRGAVAGGTVSSLMTFFDGITSTRELALFGEQGVVTVEGDIQLLVKDSDLTSQYQRFISGDVAGDYDVSIVNSTMNTTYLAGWAKVAGQINATIDGGTFSGNLALTAQAAEVTIASGVSMDICNSVINQQLRGTGSANCLIDGDVEISVSDTTVGGVIYGSYGNRVSGDIYISLNRVTAKSVVAEKTAGKVEGAKTLVITGGSSTISEGISGFDTLSIGAASELTLTQTGLLSDTVITNEGQLNVSLTNDKWTWKNLKALNGVDSFTGVSLAINGTAMADGSTLNDGNQQVAVVDGSISIKAVASYVNGNNTMDSLVSQTRTNYVKFDAGVDGSMQGRTLDRDVKFEGNGVAATAVTAGALYAGGNSLALKDLTWTGSIYGGVKDGEVASVELDLDNVKLTKDLYGAGVAATSALDVTGDVVTTLKDVTGEKSYYGAGYANSGDIAVDGVVKTAIEGGSYKAIYSGANLSANATGKSYTLGAAELTISDGVFSGIVGNGGFVRAGQTSMQGDSSLNISGGTFNAAVYGGGFAYGTGSKSTAINAGTTTVEGDINVTISGGVFNGDVFGGSLASNSHIATANTSVTGDITITLDATSAIALNGNVFAGSLGKGAVTGNTAIVVTGTGSNLSFGTASYVTGTSEYGTTINSYVSGTRTLAFDGFTGAFGGIISKGAFDTFEFSADSSVELASALDLSGNALNITGTFTDGATLLTDAAGLTWGDNTVTLFGENAVAAADGVWESDNYRLTASNGTLTIGRMN